MVNKISRRDALKMGAVGLGGGLLALSPFVEAKKKQENNMTIHIESFASSTYGASVTFIGFSHTVTNPDLHYPGLVVGISIFGSGSVTSVVTTDVDVPQNLTFLRADTDGTRRSEIWYLNNLNLSGLDTFTVEVNFSGTVDACAGSCVYNYFGGIGLHDGDTGTSTPTAELTMVPTQLNSILFSNFCINSSAGSAPAGENFPRWEVSGGSNNHGLGADAGPRSSLDSFIITYQTSGTVAWVLSGAELLDYRDNPSAIIGM